MSYGQKTRTRLYRSVYGSAIAIPGLACCPPSHAYSPPSAGETGGDGEAYELEDLAGIHHGDGRSAAVIAQRISGHGKSHPPQSDQGAYPIARWRAQGAGG